MALSDLAKTVRWRKVTWREGTKGKLAARFAWLRVWPGQGWQEGACAHAAPLGLLIEEQADGKLKFAFSNLPPDASCKKAVRLWKSRWPVEQGYQQLNEELGLDHFEGRSWRGFHHHVCLVFLAYGFLTLERHRAAVAAKKPEKTSRDTGLTLPAIRRALPKLLAPRAPKNCPHCQKPLRIPIPA